MTRPALRLRSRLLRSNLPFWLGLLVCLAGGLVIHRDFGLSWDEPLYYAYAEAVPYAYSPAAWTSGDFDLERAYGPSADDHKVYGPGYLLIAAPISRAWQAVSGDTPAEAWHLVNFAAYLVGVIGVYALLRRWVDRHPATAASLLFAFQPLLWGHAFINPKDIPFMTAFTWTVFLGLRMLDRLRGMDGLRSEPTEAASGTTATPSGVRASDRVGIGLAAGLTVATMAAYIFSPGIERLLTQMVLEAYNGPAEGLLPTLFRWIAQDAAVLTEDFYIARAVSLFSLGRSLGLAAAVVAAPYAISLLIARTSGPRHQGCLATIRQSVRGLTWLPSAPIAGWLPIVAAAGAMLGLASGLRVMGPFAGALIAASYLARRERRSLLPILTYGLVAILVMLLSWPYLWPAPLSRFLAVIERSANNPAVLTVLFEGSLFASNALPDTYLPTLLAVTLTEPALPLILGGLVVALVDVRRRRLDPGELAILVLWPLVWVTYVMLRRPPLYDGFRHFLFLLPPLFVMAGFAFQSLSRWFRHRWILAVLGILVVLPGVAGLVRLHPYPYAFFNAYVGGPAGAFRRFEADYWLTCYKHAMESAPDPGRPVTVFVPAQPSIAAEYAPPGFHFEKLDPSDDMSFPGAWLLLPTRENMDLEIHPGDPVLLSVGRAGATYCLIREVPGNSETD